MSTLVSVCVLVAGSANGFVDEFGWVKELLNTPKVCVFYGTQPLVIWALLRLWSLTGVHSGWAPERRESVAISEIALLIVCLLWERRLG